MTYSSTSALSSSSATLWTVASTSWASSSVSSTNYWYVSDPSICQHCEEKLEQAKVGKERFCSPECETAHTVAQRLGGGHDVPVQSWTHVTASTQMLANFTVISSSNAWLVPSS